MWNLVHGRRYRLPNGDIVEAFHHPGGDGPGYWMLLTLTTCAEERRR